MRDRFEDGGQLGHYCNDFIKIMQKQPGVFDRGAKKEEVRDITSTVCIYI